MADPIQAQPILKGNEQKQIHMEPVQETIQEHLTLDNQTIEQGNLQQQQQLLTQQQVHENAALATGVQKQVGPVEAKKTAKGKPLQTKAPAKESWKAKRERKRRTEEANLKVEGADHRSYEIEKQVSTYLSDRSNSVTKEVSDNLRKENVDTRVVKILCTGYKTNRSGKPKNKKEAAKKQADEQLIADYSSKQLERRKPYLEKITREVQGFTFSADMFEGEQLHENITQYKTMADKMTYFENMQRDPINKPFFQAMPPAEKELLNKRMGAMTAAFGLYLGIKTSMKGVSVNTGKYEPEGGIASATRMEDVLKQSFIEGVAEHDRAVAEGGQ